MINWRAIGYFPVVWLARPRLAVPQMTVSNLSEIDVAALAATGVTGILIDYDDTLATSTDGQLFPDSVAFASKCVSTWGDRACVFSDTAGTRRDMDDRLSRSIERQLGMTTLRHDADKPGGIEAVHRKFGPAPGLLAIVGDRLVTDIVFGNRYGFRTIWLRHEKPTGSFSGLERWLLEQ